MSLRKGGIAYSPDAARGLRRVFVRDLVVMASIGIYPEEEKAPQRVIIGIELLVQDEAAPSDVGEDQLARVVSYETVVKIARAIATAGHTRLAETLAERIAVAVLGDSRIVCSRVTVEKPDIFSDVGAVGVTVERSRA
ncbi:dihydroneopterin aldolase [Acetobacteraceae bacterium H6797]|nr:dihydroneopterin aldolase [Acetobacteraceae bacterium H6797]